MSDKNPSRPARTSAPDGPALLQGIKRQDWRAGRRAALSLGRELAGRGEIAYWVVSPEKRGSERERTDRRRDPRRRARLSSVKLLDGACRFLSEGSIRDRSATGFCLALARAVALPRELAVHIDETAEVREATMIWRRGSAIGVRLGAAVEAGALRTSDRHALKERYYAVPGSERDLRKVDGQFSDEITLKTKA